MSIKQRFNAFIANIRPTDAHLDEARRQVDYLVDALHDVVADDGSFELLKVLRAGSNAKHTSLLRTDNNVFDVDLGAYFSGEGATKAHLSKLLVFTRDCLRNIYGT